MPESYFEDATITITDAGLTAKKFLRTKPYNGPVKLSFYKGEQEQPFFTSTVNAVDGKIDKPFKHKLPVVEKTEEYYDLRVTSEYKKVNKALLSATIWPKQTQVLFKDLGNQPLKNFAFLVKQKGQVDQKLTTDGSGKCTVVLLARCPYSIVPDGKYRVIEDKQATAGQFRDHQIQVENVITAKFLAPDITQDYYKDDPDASPAKKQYVNLTSKEKEHDPDSGCDAKGHSVVFCVCSDPPEEGQAGDKVYFEINFGKESKRNDPAPKLTDDWPVHDKKAEAKKTTGWVILAPFDDMCKGFFEVELGVAGGDTCEVKIGGTSAVADAKLKLINWRKIYAQITKTAALTSPSLGPAEECFKKVNIELEESTDDEVIVANSDVPGGSIVDGTKLGGSYPAECLIVGTQNIDSFKSKLNSHFKSDKIPVAHLIYCDVQVDSKDCSYTKTVTVKGKKNGQTQGTTAFPGGGTVPGLSIAGTAADADNGLFLPFDCNNGSNPVKLCTWTEVGGTGTGAIPDTDYKIVVNGDDTNLFIRLPDAAKTLSDGGKDISVKVKLAFAKGWYNGWCTGAGRHLVIRVGRADNEICGTIVHEIGHAIFQAPDSAGPFPGLKAPPHERHYTNNRGHQGSHCADGLDDTNYNNATFKMNTSTASAVCTCVMYGAGSDVRNADLKFCAKCEPYVKAVKIESVST